MGGSLSSRVTVFFIAFSYVGTYMSIDKSSALRINFFICLSQAQYSTCPSLTSFQWDIRTFRLVRTVPALDQCQIIFNHAGDVIYGK